jgi:ElaB/YqjD/DUF883 family membrane-anchored ribosome-binding protein
MKRIDDLIENSRSTAAVARGRVQSAYGKAKAGASNAADAGRSYASEIGARVKPAAERGKAGAKQANDRLKKAAEENPLTLVAGALAVGALLGTLLPKRTSHDE